MTTEHWLRQGLHGRCVSCGLLGTDDGDEEVRPLDRANLGPVKRAPVCFVHHVWLFSEMLDTQPVKEIDLAQTSRQQVEEMMKRAATEVILKDRECPKWVPYQLGFSPKVHAERQRADEAEKERRDFERRLEADRRQWERRLEDERRAWELRQAEATREREGRFNTIMFRLTVAAVALAVAEVLAAVVSLTGDSWIIRVFERIF